MIDVADSNAVYYYHYDGLGSVVALSDANGVVVEKYKYDVFGQPMILDPNNEQLTTSNYANPYMFTGRRYDSEVGLYYYRFRYYRPEIGRFLQTDPIGYFAGLNLYTYVGNNPLNWIDPWGLCEKDKLGKRLTDEDFYIELDDLRNRLKDIPPDTMMSWSEMIDLYSTWDTDFHSLWKDDLFYYDGRTAYGRDLNHYAIAMLMKHRGLSKLRGGATVALWKLGYLFSPKDWPFYPTLNTWHFWNRGYNEYQRPPGWININRILPQTLPEFWSQGP